ncbi:WD repeat-containing protein 54 [Intoshia linei]|uniref:WD repeat-containing protein 54 n=1 Tax=Intoshia linei TaxID=1819745 RepID=A0A177AW55_9BILA|nr:WD repeat-containing protein 54 [Intoshia linei]
MEYQNPLINNSTFKLTSSVLNKNLDKNNVYKKFQFNGILHEIQDNKYMIELDNTSVLINYFGDVCKDGNIVCSTNKTGKKNYSLFVKDDYFGYSDTLLNKKSMKNIFSPLPGTIERIMVKKGEMVVKGQTLLVVTAMKMEHLLKATIDGKIENILFDIGEIVKNNELLIKMDCTIYIYQFYRFHKFTIIHVTISKHKQMYARSDKALPLKITASAVTANLCTYVDVSVKKIYYVVIHNDKLDFVIAQMDGTSVHHKLIVCKHPTDNKTVTIITQANLHKINNSMILVVTENVCINFFNPIKMELLYVFMNNEIKTNCEYISISRFYRGIAFNKTCIYIGNSEGIVTIFEFYPKNCQVKVIDKIQHDKSTSPITDLKVLSDLMVTCHEDGSVMWWRTNCFNIEFIKLCENNNVGAALICQFYIQNIIAGFEYGIIKMFTHTKNEPLFLINGHSRIINDIAVCHHLNIIRTSQTFYCCGSLKINETFGGVNFASASDDGKVNLWKIDTKNQMKITFIEEHCIENRLIYGCKFMDPNGKVLGFSCYDQNHIHFLIKA